MTSFQNPGCTLYMQKSEGQEVGAISYKGDIEMLTRLQIFLLRRSREYLQADEEDSNSYLLGVLELSTCQVNCEGIQIL